MDNDYDYQKDSHYQPQAAGARPMVDPEALGEVDPTK